MHMNSFGAVKPAETHNNYIYIIFHFLCAFVIGNNCNAYVVFMISTVS